MPKSQVSDLITDQEITFAHLVLSGTMTDRQAAEAAGLNSDTAAYTKAKPRVRAYMLEHRAAMHDRVMQQQAEEQRRLNQGRERVLARLWEIADLDPDMTRNSMSAQIKALSMIVAIEGLIPNRHDDRRAPAPQPRPDSVRDEHEPGVPDPPPGKAAGAPSHLGSTPGPDFDLSGSIFPRPSNPSEAIPRVPHAPVSAFAPDNRVPSSMEKKPDTLRLRL
jgi:hypothetical protein